MPERSIAQPSAAKVWSAQEMERGVIIERNHRELLQPYTDAVERGDEVAPDAEWIFNQDYVAPPALFVRRAGAKREELREDEVARPIENLKRLAQQAREAERIGNADGKSASLNCYFHFSETRGRLTAKAWQAWRERWRLASRTQDWSCLYEMLGDAAMITRTGMRLRVVALMIALRRWSKVLPANARGMSKSPCAIGELLAN